MDTADFKTRLAIMQLVSESFTRSDNAEMLNFLEVVKCLCTAHHVLLHKYYYHDIRDRQAHIERDLALGAADL